MSKEKDALAVAFAVLRLLAQHSLSPTQTSMASRAAGNCLWALGIESYEGIKAVAPEKDVLDLQASRIRTAQIEHRQPTPAENETGEEA